MNLSYNWLKEYIDFNLTPDELKEKLTFSGLEVEQITSKGTDLAKLKVAQIIGKAKHPNADKLSICKVNDGSSIKQVICGAPNCKKNQKVAFAPIGTKISNHKIKEVKLRGKKSFGMICSEKEIGLSNDHSGIMELDSDAEIGQSLAHFLDLPDTIYELEVTPNRPDWLGVIGIARDLSALINKKLHLPDYNFKTADKNIKSELSLINEAPEDCIRYTALLIKNVKVKESPQWLKNRLISIGLRPINNIVDITNYVMMEYGHPLHAFDYDKIKDKTIIVRKAKTKEQISALDDKTYSLNCSDLVIADAEKPIALAGIIGSNNSHITMKTQNIVLEAACFKYSTIRKTTNRLKLITDSSYRFERDLSAKTTNIISQRAAALISQIATGTIMSGKLDSFPDAAEDTEVKLRVTRVKKILNIHISKKKIINYLKPLGLSLIRNTDDELTFLIPHFRKDLTREIDLIEEIIRLHGYNNVPSNLQISHIMDKKSFYLRRKIKDILVSYGFNEVINWSFGDLKDLDKLALNPNHRKRKIVKIKNPLGKDSAILRTFILPDLLNNCRYNLNREIRNQKLFELHKIFFKSEHKLPAEEYEICGILTGQQNPLHWQDKDNKIDFFYLKGIIEDILKQNDLKNYQFIESNAKYLQKGLSADIIKNGKMIGSIGKLNQRCLQEFEIETPIYTFYLNLSVLIKLSPQITPQYKPISKYPAIYRDLSFIISKEIKFSHIVSTIKEIKPSLIKQVKLFDVYTGKKIDNNKRSLSFNIVFHSEHKTLTDNKINKLMNQIIDKLQEKYKIKMR